MALLVAHWVDIIVRIFKTFLGTIVLLMLWSIIFGLGNLNGWWHAPIAEKGNSEALQSALIETAENEYRGNLAMVLIENGTVVTEHFASKGTPVDGETLFQVASLSKWVSALGIMKLVEDGTLDLDAPVSTYLTRWQLPESEFDNDGVTLRRLLSHTAGLTDGLGYAGYLPDQSLPSLETSLTKAPDASPGASGIVRVGIEPGSQFEYSGGGYTLMQLIIEEVTDQSFNDFMVETIFRPLGMERTSYIVDEKTEENVADLYDVDGTIATHFKFVSLAATSLYTNTNDLTKLVQAHFLVENGDQITDYFLSKKTLKKMREPHASQMGANIWGLGVILYAPNEQGSFIVGHDGSNEPAINTTVRFDPDTQDAIIILETGNPLLATKLAGDWTFWQTGYVDLLTVMMEIEQHTQSYMRLSPFALIFAISLSFFLFGRKKRP